MLFARMLRAARLDPALYTELRSEPLALTQGLLVLLLASLAIAVGAGIREVGESHAFSRGVVAGLFVMPGLWLIQAASAFFLGRVAIDPGQAKGSGKDLLAAILFATAPGVLFVGFALPGTAGFVVATIVRSWIVFATGMAVRGTMDVPYYRGLIAAAPGFLLSQVLVGLSGT